MPKRLLHIIVILLFILLCPIYISAASLPQGTGNGDGKSYTGGYDNNSSTDPMMQRIIDNGGPGIDVIGTANWVLNDQTPTPPTEYWTNADWGPFQQGDTLVFSDGDTISLWTGTYSGFLESYLIRWGGQDHPLGATMYFEELPLEDATFPLLLLLSFYATYKIRRRKKALN